MPYITPPNTPVGTVCWRVLVPNDDTAIAAFLGQLSELYQEVNWEQDGGISVAETAALFDTMYETLETGCGNMLGSLVHYVTTSPPPSVLPCDGTQYLRTDYPDLYAVLPPSLIIDADNFITPDVEDKFLLGAGITYPVEDVGGEADVTLTEAQLPAHSHGYNYPNIIVQFNTGGAPNSDLLGSPPLSLQTTTVGNGEAHNNLPPYVAYRVGIIAK